MTLETGISYQNLSILVNELEFAVEMLIGFLAVLNRMKLCDRVNIRSCSLYESFH